MFPYNGAFQQVGGKNVMFSHAPALLWGMRDVISAWRGDFFVISGGPRSVVIFFGEEGMELIVAR